MLKIWLKSMVFLDTNVILEIILQNRPKQAQVITYLENLNETTAVSMLSVHLIKHFGRKAQIDDALLDAVIVENELLSLTKDDYQWAELNEKGNDYEDALQIAVALNNGCNKFVTLDKKLTKQYVDLPMQIIILQ